MNDLKARLNLPLTGFDLELNRPKGAGMNPYSQAYMKATTAPPPSVPPAPKGVGPTSCDFCRSQKRRCDRQRPCGSCTARRVECVYTLVDSTAALNEVRASSRKTKLASGLGKEPSGVYSSSPSPSLSYTSSSASSTSSTAHSPLEYAAPASTATSRVHRNRLASSAASTASMSNLNRSFTPRQPSSSSTLTRTGGSTPASDASAMFLPNLPQRSGSWRSIENALPDLTPIGVGPTPLPLTMSAASGSSTGRSEASGPSSTRFPSFSSATRPDGMQVGTLGSLKVSPFPPFPSSSESAGSGAGPSGVPRGVRRSASTAGLTAAQSLRTSASQAQLQPSLYGNESSPRMRKGSSASSNIPALPAVSGPMGGQDEWTTRPLPLFDANDPFNSLALPSAHGGHGSGNGMVSLSPLALPPFPPMPGLDSSSSSTKGSGSLRRRASTRNLLGASSASSAGYPEDGLVASQFGSTAPDFLSLNPSNSPFSSNLALSSRRKQSFSCLTSPAHPSGAASQYRRPQAAHSPSPALTPAAPGTFSTPQLPKLEPLPGPLKSSRAMQGALSGYMDGTDRQSSSAAELALGVGAFRPPSPSHMRSMPALRQQSGAAQTSAMPPLQPSFGSDTTPRISQGRSLNRTNSHRGLLSQYEGSGF